MSLPGPSPIRHDQVRLLIVVTILAQILAFFVMVFSLVSGLYAYSTNAGWYRENVVKVP